MLHELLRHILYSFRNMIIAALSCPFSEKIVYLHFKDNAGSEIPKFIKKNKVAIKLNFIIITSILQSITLKGNRLRESAITDL